MCVALVGGMNRLKRRYERTALGYGVDLRHFERVALALNRGSAEWYEGCKAT